MGETICIVGLGYVGLPLALAFSKHFPVIGFDVNEKRIMELQQGKDSSSSVFTSDFQNRNIQFTSNADELKKATVIIVAVPTPVDEAKRPDLSYLQNASSLIGKNLQKGTLVIYESTVYPGVTEDVCLSILEKESGLQLGEFDLGYSPERINPGDNQHRLDTVIKIVSGHSPESLERIAKLYETIITVGVYRAQSIKVAEAAKITENIQRDVNIALMNELSMVYHKLGIDTKNVLDAAETKWNFHKYYPGLVGGHCIGIDPYYLAFQATQKGYHPKLILAGREINDYMAKHIAELCMKELNKKGKVLKNSTVLLLGLTFKENVTDFRNSRAKDVVDYLKEYGITVYGCEPHMTDVVVKEQYNIEPVSLSTIPVCDAIIVINKHTQFNSLTPNNLQCSILLDIKHMFSQKETEEKGITYITL
jgi:UDP-N-acetyl-D-galactosamine dehydrogenase